MTAKRAVSLSFTLFFLLSGVFYGIPRTPARNPAAVPDLANCQQVSTAPDLAALLNSDFQGAICIPNTAEIDLSGYYSLPVKKGVRIHSSRGLTRQGALLYTRDLLGPLQWDGTHAGYPLFEVIGNDVTIDGLRLQGPSQTPDELQTVFAIRVDSALARRVVIRDNELFGWTGAAVEVKGPILGRCMSDLAPGEGRDMNVTQAAEILISGNSIHHNVRDSLGYGVAVSTGAFALIEGNVFDYNRHDIASDGTPYTGYIARDNYLLEGGYKEKDRYFNQHFDMHGCGSGGYDGGAGEYIEIAYNTFRGDQPYALGFRTRPAFWLRGTPTQGAWFLNNTLVHDDADDALRNNGDDGHLHESGNAYGTDHSLELAVGDFDGDGIDDVFLATGSGWYYSSGGVAPWRLLTRSKLTLEELAFGDFDGDGKTDIFFVSPSGQWNYFSPGAGVFKHDLASSSVPLSELRFGDFDGDGKTDVFYADGTQWRISWAARSEWAYAATSHFRPEKLRFGDFDGDGKTDVFALANGSWSWVRSGQGKWQKLNDRLSPLLETLVFGDFDGDGKTDIAEETDGEWRYSAGGQTGWTRLRDKGVDPQYSELQAGVVGHFTPGKRVSILRYDQLPTIEVATQPRVIWSPGRSFVRWTGGIGDDHFTTVSRQMMR